VTVRAVQRLGRGQVKAGLRPRTGQVPADAITNKDGDPGFRLVDTQGDGYLDVLWMRPDKPDGKPDRGLALNDGHGWTNRQDALVPTGLSFVDKDGIDQGVRLLSVTGKGLTDIVASFAGRAQRVELNRSRRADVLNSLIDGYGLKTNVYYQTLLEADGSGACGSNVPHPLSKRIIRQGSISSTRNVTYELDGRIVSSGTNSFAYDTTAGVLERHGNVLSTLNALDDGSSITKTNEYKDDLSRWFLGRLTKSTVDKVGHPENGLGSPRKMEKRCSSFEYDASSGMLAAQIVNCGKAKAVTTRFKRDASGNIIEKSVTAVGEQEQTTKSEFDAFGRYEIASTDVLGHRSKTERDPGTGQPISVTDPNGVKITFEYDPFGRLRKQTSPTGVAISTDLIDAGIPGALPSIDAHDISSGLSAAVRYEIKTEIGSLPPSWALFDVKGRELRQARRGFTTDSAAIRYIFSSRWNTMR
jgi:YD repeat-containing protein